MIITIVLLYFISDSTYANNFCNLQFYGNDLFKVKNITYVTQSSVPRYTVLCRTRSLLSNEKYVLIDLISYEPNKLKAWKENFNVTEYQNKSFFELRRRISLDWIGNGRISCKVQLYDAFLNKFDTCTKSINLAVLEEYKGPTAQSTKTSFIPLNSSKIYLRSRLKDSPLFFNQTKMVKNLSNTIQSQKHAIDQKTIMIIQNAQILIGFCIIVVVVFFFFIIILFVSCAIRKRKIQKLINNNNDALLKIESISDERSIY